ALNRRGRGDPWPRLRPHDPGALRQHRPRGCPRPADGRSAGRGLMGLPIRSKPRGPQFPAWDRQLCAWSSCRGQLPDRVRGSAFFQLDGWQPDDDGGWEKASTGTRHRSWNRVRKDGEGEPLVVENMGGIAKIALPTHFHCPYNIEHTNDVTG